MPRPIINRKVGRPPCLLGFQPYGMPETEAEEVRLQIDEYESFRLVDYEALSQDEAAGRMNVSRPTFTRIYNSALKKIALAFVEAKVITIEGGRIEFGREWFRCRKCFKLIEGLNNHKKCSDCNSFGEKELMQI